MGIEQLGRVQNLGRNVAELAESAGSAVTKLLDGMPWRQISGQISDSGVALRTQRVATDAEFVPHFRLYDDSEGLEPGWTMVRADHNESTRVYNRAKDSVFKVLAGDDFGSGFMINDRFALTANHAIADKSNQLIPDIVAKLPDGSATPLRVLARATAEDMALVHLPEMGNQLPSLELTRSSALKSDTMLYGVGNAEDRQSILTGGKYEHTNFESAGRYSRFEDFPRQNVAFWQAMIPSWGGFSGGPLLDSSGKVAGLMTNRFMYHTFGPISEHLQVMAELTKGPLPERGWLELTTEALKQPNSKNSFTVRQLGLAART